MVIYAARVRWKDLSAILALTAAFALCLLGGQPQSAPVSAPLTAETETDLTSYLASLGWETSGAPVSEQVLLPKSFGPEYDGYLAIQAEGGFDLAAYTGKTVTRYSYTVTNYPTGESGILADLLVLDGEIIGGELRSTQLDGFMTALTPRQPE